MFSFIISKTEISSCIVLTVRFLFRHFIGHWTLEMLRFLEKFLYSTFNKMVKKFMQRVLGSRYKGKTSVLKTMMDLVVKKICQYPFTILEKRSILTFPLVTRCKKKKRNHLWKERIALQKSCYMMTKIYDSFLQTCSNLNYRPYFIVYWIFTFCPTHL